MIGDAYDTESYPDDTPEDVARHEKQRELQRKWRRKQFNDDCRSLALCMTGWRATVGTVRAEADPHDEKHYLERTYWLAVRVMRRAIAWGYLEYP